MVQYASADPRLGQFTASTVGLKWGTKPNRKTEFSVRVQSYVQNGNAPAVTLPALQGLDLYPSLKSTLLQVGMKVDF